ncbi:hypothetical protein V5O48_019411, partial [Marasmius crinis-equi]
LQSLVYHGGFKSYEHFPEDTNPVINSTLTTLSVQLRNEDGLYALLHDFFRGVTFPSVTNLGILFDAFGSHRSKKNFIIPGAWPRNELHRFMDRSGCVLTTLSLEGIPLAESDIVALLKHAPSVHEFTLSELWAVKPEPGELSNKEPPSKLYKSVTRSFLTRLRSPGFAPDAFSAQTPLLPKLTSFKLSVQSHFDADQAFVDMVKSRWDRSNVDIGEYPTKRLRTVVLYVMNRKLVQDVYEPLKMLDREGMMVNVFGNG